MSPINRRDFFSWTQLGLGGAALASLLQSPAINNAQGADQTASLHFSPRAKRAIHICLCGGLSHIDSFDPKPELVRLHGKSLSSDERPDVFFGQVGLLRQSDWQFKPRGESGLLISDLFPHISTIADELTIIRSMVADSSSHTPATFQENSGFRFNGYPTLGAWLSYGLGAEAEDLPSYVVLPDSRGLPASGTNNWTSGFLPARHQGIGFGRGPVPIYDLFPPDSISRETDIASRELLAEINSQDAEKWAAEDELLTRVRNYDLAAKMQDAIPRVADLSNESQETLNSYGMNRPETRDFGRNCLLGRRLLERGVRFVQLFSGGDFSSPRINWDAHENVKENHTQEALRIDQPVAALIKDLRQRGMLDDTLVIFSSEFGRTPFTQSASDTVGAGRDHNPHGFSVWLAGAGLKHGTAYGATDDIGWKATENPVTWPDFHATILHLLGIDHERLTYYHNGIQRRLTNVHGHVVHVILS